MKMSSLAAAALVILGTHISHADELVAYRLMVSYRASTVQDLLLNVLRERAAKLPPDTDGDTLHRLMEMAAEMRAVTIEQIVETGNAGAIANVSFRVNDCGTLYRTTLKFKRTTVGYKYTPSKDEKVVAENVGCSG